MRSLISHATLIATELYCRAKRFIRDSDDRGMTTLETVIITIGLIAVAVAFVTILKAVVEGKLQQIN